jgi:polyisoprenoid-binding protein YceI
MADAHELALITNLENCEMAGLVPQPEITADSRAASKDGNLLSISSAMFMRNGRGRSRAMALVAIALVMRSSIGVSGATRTYRVDPSRSHTTIHVGKAGAFSFIAGHTHEVIGPLEDGSVDLDPDNPSQSRIRLAIATSDLKVSAQGEPEGDAPKVQEAMNGEKVLDVAHHPRITFESTGVTLKSRRGTVLDVIVAGALAIRGVSQTVSVPVRVEIAEGALTATGRFTVKQSAFGIKPISVGGVVAVKDTLDIEFSVAATAK